MKQKLILSLTVPLAAAAMLATAHARTWTSADGTKTFDGAYISSTETSVTVRKSGREVSFKLDLLSEADRTWIKEEAARRAKEDKAETGRGTIGDQKIGKKLRGKTVRLIGKKFTKEDTAKVPQYYLLYFSASW